MSLSIDGVWKAGVWATTVWADGVWYEGPPTVTATTKGGGPSESNRLEAITTAANAAELYEGRRRSTRSHTGRTY